MATTIRTFAPAAAMVISAAWALLGCGGDVGKDAGAVMGPRTDQPYEVVNGRTYDASEYPPEPLPNVYVCFYCDTCGGILLLDDYADHAADYTLYSDDDLSEHNGHTLRGVASYPLFNNDTRYIYNFQWGNIPYTVGFYLTPQ